MKKDNLVMEITLDKIKKTTMINNQCTIKSLMNSHELQKILLYMVEIIYQNHLI